jgi:hypothetical protein
VPPVLFDHIAIAEPRLADAEPIRGADDDGALVYRWPGSSMRIAVEIDPHRDEGPLCIEYASPRPVALADSAPPVLGAVFRLLPTG